MFVDGLAMVVYMYVAIRWRCICTTGSPTLLVCWSASWWDSVHGTMRVHTSSHVCHCRRWVYSDICVSTNSLLITTHRYKMSLIGPVIITAQRACSYLILCSTVKSVNY